MSTTVIPGDVNVAFADERARQLATAADAAARLQRRLDDGTLTAIGGDRYRVTDPGSLDNGEIVTVTAGRIVAEHGLDLTTGAAALYTTTPAWHALGTVVPGGTADIDEVLRLARIGFDVHRRPVLFRNAADGPTLVMGGQFVTVRDDTGAPLGVVGSDYRVLQNRDAFEFLTDLVERTDVVWESAGALREGRRVFVAMRLPEGIRIDPGGVDDEIVPFLVAINSHDGSSLFQVVATPWRPVCANTERFAVRDAHTRWGVRHTASARDRIEEARRTLGLTDAYYRAFAAEEQALARTQVTIDEFRDLLDELWPAPADGATERARRNHRHRHDALVELWDANTAALGRTGYAAERAVTEFLDWKVTVRPTGSLRGQYLAARATAVLEGTADDRKSAVHRRLLALTRR